MPQTLSSCTPYALPVEQIRYSRRSPPDSSDSPDDAAAFSCAFSIYAPAFPPHRALGLCPLICLEAGPRPALLRSRLEGVFEVRHVSTGTLLPCRVGPLWTAPTPSPCFRCPPRWSVAYDVRRGQECRSLPGEPSTARRQRARSAPRLGPRHRRALPFLLRPHARHHAGVNPIPPRATLCTRCWRSSQPTSPRRLLAHCGSSAVYCCLRPTPGPAVLPGTTFTTSRVRSARNGRSSSPAPLLSRPRAPSASPTNSTLPDPRTPGASSTRHAPPP
jgi:hypothetical protein